MQRAWADPRAQEARDKQALAMTSIDLNSRDNGALLACDMRRDPCTDRAVER